MKNILNICILALSVLFMVACDPQEDSDYELGVKPKAEDMNFTATPSSGKANIIILQNTSDVPGVAVWELGDGSKTKGDSVATSYPFKGDYTVVMTLYTSGGSESISKTITIENDDMSLLSTPMYTALTGGADNVNGKTWVFDQYHNGHFGVGPADASSPSWWSCPAEGKTKSCLYSQEFTFTQVGVKLQWKNNGNVYSNEAGRKALAALGYPNSAVPGDGDFDVQFTPAASYTFSLNEAAKTLTLSNGAFLGHYAGTSTYQILKLDENELYVKCLSTTEAGNGWWYRFIPKEKNIKPVIPVAVVPLSETFENEKPKVTFAKEDMGELTNFYYLNPAPVPLNKSSRVCMYQKDTTKFYSNLSVTVKGYKFDLAVQNKIKLKVFIPSYNDYTTANNVAGDWIANNKLQKKVEVKLQDSGLGGNAWSNQASVVFDNLETDKWIELTFDFSSFSARKDFDKIVVQFGGEGHGGTGLFFFDDFAFSE